MFLLNLAAKVVIHQTLSVLEDIVESISGEATKSRQICYQSLQESVQVSLALFPAFIHQSGIITGAALATLCSSVTHTHPTHHRVFPGLKS